MLQPLQFFATDPSSFAETENMSERQNRCSSCSLHQLCLPTGLDASEMHRLDRIIVRKRRLRRDESLYCMDDPFTHLYAVRLGHFKTYQVTEEGAEQITGFQMGGELLGMEAISTDQHHSYAVALEDSEVCEIPFALLEELFGEIPTLLRHFHRIMSQQITRDQSAMLLLGNMRAEQRFAAFLINLSSRYKTRGYSPVSFQLRMSREDIGNYLGLTIESVSRLISRFKKQRWINVSSRDVQILDLPALKTLMMGTSAGH